MLCIEKQMVFMSYKKFKIPFILLLTGLIFFNVAGVLLFPIKFYIFLVVNLKTIQTILNDT